MQIRQMGAELIRADGHAEAHRRFPQLTRMRVKALLNKRKNKLIVKQ